MPPSGALEHADSTDTDQFTLYLSTQRHPPALPNQRQLLLRLHGCLVLLALQSGADALRDPPRRSFEAKPGFVRSAFGRCESYLEIRVAIAELSIRADSVPLEQHHYA